MKVFLSWSGKQSHAVAEAFGEWLSKVIQAVEPWISSEIEKGARWQTEVADRLDEAKIGIVCLTSSNLTSPWILFEAGALSKTKDSLTCIFLLDISPTDIEPPLSQFQHTIFDREDLFKLVSTINTTVGVNGGRALSADTLAATFGTFWPQLETEFKDIAAAKTEKTIRRSDRDLLEEVLAIVRNTAVEPPLSAARQAPIRPAEIAADAAKQIEQFPSGIPVLGHPGFVTSPFSSNQGFIDVRRFAPGTPVRDPYTGMIFRVPPLREAFSGFQSVDFEVPETVLPETDKR